MASWRHLGAILRTPGTVLEASGGVLEPFWSHLGSIRGALDGVWRRLAGFREVLAESMKFIDLFWFLLIFTVPEGALEGSRGSQNARGGRLRALGGRSRAP